MKQTFTVRLPIRADRAVRRAITKRAAVDGEASDFVLDALLHSGRQASDPDLLAFAIDTLHDFSEEIEKDDAWASDHIATAYRALADYRTAIKDASRTDGSTQVPALVRAADRNRREVDVHAMIDRKAAFGEPWEAVEASLLDIIASGQGHLTFNVRSLGCIEVRGAGPRALGSDQKIDRVVIENRGDKYYLSAVVSHRTEAARKPLNRSYSGVLRIAVTPATIVADSAGIAARFLVSEARAIHALSARTRSEIVDAPSVRDSRKMMDARHNFFRQYAVLVARHAAENNLAVELSFYEANTMAHPRILGVSKRHRKDLVAELFRQSAKRGVMFLFPRTPALVPFTTCGHPQDVLVGYLTDEPSIRGLCERCANDSSW